MAALDQRRVKPANVTYLSSFRLVFVMSKGREVFLATHGMGRRESGIAHRKVFDHADEAAHYARSLAALIGCRITGLDDDEDVA